MLKMLGSLLKKASNFTGSGAWSISEHILMVSITLSAVSPHPFSRPHSFNLQNTLAVSKDVSWKFLKISMLTHAMLRSKPRLEILIWCIFRKTRDENFSYYQSCLKLVHSYNGFINHKFLQVKKIQNPYQFPAFIF